MQQRPSSGAAAAAAAIVRARAVVARQGGRSNRGGRCCGCGCGCRACVLVLSLMGVAVMALTALAPTNGGDDGRPGWLRSAIATRASGSGNSAPSAQQQSWAEAEGAAATLAPTPAATPSGTPSPTPTPTRPPPPPVMLLTYATEATPALCDYLLSAVLAGYERVGVLGWEEAWQRRAVPQLQHAEYFMGKRALAAVQYMERHAATYGSSGDDTLFAFTDGYDVLMEAGPTAIQAAYRAAGVSLLAATENDAWPPLLEPYYPVPRAGARYKYLNGGGWVGTRAPVVRWLTALMAVRSEYRSHELVYNQAGEIVGDGFADEGYEVPLPPCLGVNTTSWDLVWLCPAVPAGSGLSEWRAGDEEAAVVATRRNEWGHALPPPRRPPPDVVAAPRKLTVPPFLRRNDQIIATMLYQSSAESLGVGLDTDARFMQSMQLEAGIAAEHVAVCTRDAATGGLVPDHVTPRCPWPGALFNRFSPAGQPATLPAAVHFNGPAKYTITGEVGMAAVVAAMRAAAQARYTRWEAALAAMQRVVTFLRGGAEPVRLQLSRLCPAAW